MTTMPMTRGWHQHEDDPPGVQRWFDGSSWTSRTTGRPRPDAPKTVDAPATPEPAAATTSAAINETTHIVTHTPAQPAAPPGWYTCPGDPDGMQRWYDGARWTERVTATHPIATTPLIPAASPTPTPAVPLETTRDTYVTPPASRGWHTRPGDPPGVQRWYNGTRWTDRTTGGTASRNSQVQRAQAEVLPAAPSGFVPMLYNPSTGQTAHVNQATGTVQIQQRYSNGRRLFYAGLWAFYTVILLISGFGLLFGGQILSGLVALALAFFTGRYALRIWTYRARRLFFLLFF